VKFEDYLEIRNLINRYAHLIDQAKNEECAQLFAHADVHTPDAVCRSDPKAMLAIYNKYNKVYEDTGTLRTRHITTNVILEDDGPNFAKSQAYVVVFQAAPGFPLQPIIAGTYHDRFEKVDGKWRFKERHFNAKNFELVGDLSHHLKLDVAGMS
jgi:SnoaL-like domain